MSKALIENFVFDASAKTIEFTDYFTPGIDLQNVLLVYNATDQIFLFVPGDVSKGGSVAGNVLTLEYDTTTMSDSDKILIYYEDPLVPLKVVLDSRSAGERISEDYVNVGIEGLITRITTATTTVVKAAPGRLVALICVNPQASATATVYNNTAGSGTVLMAPAFPATLLSSGPAPMFFGGAQFTTGLTIVTTGTAEWLAIID